MEFFPNTDRVAALALIVETIDTIDLAAFVIASEQKEVLLEFDLISEQKDDGLKTVFAAIDIVSKEQIVGLRRETTILEKSEEIRELTVCVT